MAGKAARPGGERQPPAGPARGRPATWPGPGPPPITTPNMAWPGMEKMARTTAVEKPEVRTYITFSTAAKPRETNTPVDHPIKAVVEVGFIPGAPTEDPVLDPLLNEPRHHEVGQEEVDHGPPVEKVDELVGQHLQHQNGNHGQPPRRKRDQSRPGVPAQSDPTGR